jgi:sorbitol/mannitol transport system substrate-binding protein
VAPFHSAGQAALDGAGSQATAFNRHYTGIQYIGIPEFPAIGGQVGAELAKVVTGQQTVPQGLQRSQAVATGAIAAAGYGAP